MNMNKILGGLKIAGIAVAGAAGGAIVGLVLIKTGVLKQEDLFKVKDILNNTDAADEFAEGAFNVTDNITD